jgi:hypothetical protein
MVDMCLVSEFDDLLRHGAFVSIMCRMMGRARKIGGALDRLPEAQTSFDVAIVVAIDGDDASEDEEVRNRTTEA